MATWTAQSKNSATLTPVSKTAMSTEQQNFIFMDGNNHIFMDGNNFEFRSLTNNEWVGQSKS